MAVSQKFNHWLPNVRRMVAGGVQAVTVALGILMLVLPAGTAQTNPPATTVATTNQITHLPGMTVTGRQDSQLGIADSASQGTTGQAQLADRPILRSGCPSEHQAIADRRSRTPSMRIIF